MIYTGLSRTGEIETVKAHGGADVAEVYGGINEANPIYYKTRTITGQTPLSYKALSKPLSDYLISGNTMQDGTPTPDNHVDVVGCGDRTKNLLDNQMSAEVNLRGVKYTKNADGSVKVFGTASSQVSYCILMGDGAATNDLSASTTPIFKAGDTIKFVFSGLAAQIRYTDGTYEANVSGIVTLTKDVGLVYIQVVNEPINTTVYPMITLSTETDTGYEPYGYKLPPTVNGTEYPIYLGQVPTTRRIRKVVFDGTEQGWGKNTGLTNSNAFSIAMSNWVGNRKLGYCTHYQNVTDAQAAEGIFFGNSLNILTALADGLDDVTKFKQWLSAQYAAGTPVTVWYVLAEPETGIVNEPLMKIGDYADTVSMAQASVTIPTIAGTNTLTVDTTVQPSAVSITGNIKEVS